MSKFSYIGQRYSQGASSCTLISFTADACDILRWGGVPAKNERFHGGFQRALSARYRKIISYFDNGQISPGAVVVAFRPGTLQMTELGYPSSWPESGKNISATKFVHLEFSSEDYDELTLEQLIQRVRNLLESRPGLASGEPAETNSESIEDKDNDDGIDDIDKSAEESDQEDDLDVGHSKLKAFYDFIGNSDAVDQWIKSESDKISAVKSKKNLSQAEKEYVAYLPEEKLKATLTSLLRPAMIVDGQHRVNGANESEKEGIVFTVCAIKDADWVEQVFQFVVLNKMAKPISKDFLTELLNTSLTNIEVEDIDKRLETIGIKNADRKIHKYVNHDPRSPFSGLVAEAGEVAGSDNSGKISQQGMLALAKRWRTIASVGKTSEMNCYIKYLTAAGLGEARQAWQDYEKWIPLFFAFWAEIKSLYEPHHIWIKQKNYNLLYVVTLQALQDLFIESKAKAKVKFKSLDDFKEQVREFFADVPPTFFVNWTQTGLQSGTGWDDIKEAIEMFQNGSTLQKVQKESKLFN